MKKGYLSWVWISNNFNFKEKFIYDQLNKQKSIRLDVLKGNVPAEKLYSRMGFKYPCTLSMYYEDVGLTDYKIYELSLYVVLVN